MRVGKQNRPVTLSQKAQAEGDPTYEALSPSNWWCQIQPVAPQGDGRTTMHLVTMRFHPQVTVDTCISFADLVLLRTRTLFVTGVQNVGDANTEMKLLCEEIAP